jgi:hypothetical protein
LALFPPFSVIPRQGEAFGIEICEGFKYICRMLRPYINGNDNRYLGQNPTEIVVLETIATQPKSRRGEAFGQKFFKYSTIYLPNASP